MPTIFTAASPDSSLGRRNEAAVSDVAGRQLVNGNEPTPGVPRDRVIPLRKSDIIGGLQAEGLLDEAAQAECGHFARLLGAIFHYQYLEKVDRLREAYFHFDPEVDPRTFSSATDLDKAYRALSEEFIRVLEDANFVELGHDEIRRVHPERARLRVRIKAPVEDYRDVRMFRRGHHIEVIEDPIWFGLRKHRREVLVYDDVVLMIATKPAPPTGAHKTLASARHGGQKVRDGAVLFKYFRHIARADLKALFPNARVVRSLFDHLTLGVPAIIGGVPILIKLASTLTVLFLVGGFYLGMTGGIGDNDTERALAALSGLFALGAFVLRQWGSFHRQSLIHQKQLTENIYYRNMNNNSGIFTYIIGEAEDQDWKEALLAYFCLSTAETPLARETLDARVEELLSRAFGVTADFEIDSALAWLKRLDLLQEADGHFSAVPLVDALARLDRQWSGIFSGKAAGPP